MPTRASGATVSTRSFCCCFCDLVLAIREFLLRVEGPVAEIGGPVHGRADAVVAGPCSLHIRIAPRCLRLPSSLWPRARFALIDGARPKRHGGHAPQAQRKA